MGLKQYGDQGYKFGFTQPEADAIAATIGLTPQEITFPKEPEIEAEGKNTEGRTVAYVLDTDGKVAFTMSGYVSNKALFEQALGLTVQYRGRNLIINKAEDTEKAGDFQMGNVSGLSFPLVTDSVGQQIGD